MFSDIAASVGHSIINKSQLQYQNFCDGGPALDPAGVLSTLPELLSENKCDTHVCLDAH